MAADRPGAQSPADTVHYLDATSPDASEFSAEEWETLTTINQKVAAGQTLNEVMNFLFESTRGICPCDRIGLGFLEENGQRVIAHWARALYEPLLLVKGFAQDLRGSSLEAVLQSGRPRVISDLEQYLNEHPESVSTGILVREGVRSSMTCPLIVEGRAVGFLWRSSRQRNAYDRHQVRIHLAIAERVSQAVEKAWRIEQLDAANRAYFKMLGFVSHELKSPLASLVMDAELLVGDYAGPLEPQQRQKVHRMIEKAQYLLGLIGEYLNLARIESGEFAGNFDREVDLVAEVATPAIEIVQNLMDQMEAVLHRETPPAPVRVQCDPSLLTIALVNLLGNAVKYGEKRGEIRLRVAQDQARTRVSVWNRGPGFPREERSKLFRKFSRLQTPELLKRKGTGVGLYTTWWVIQLHGGRIWAESEVGQWAEFSFEIPNRQAREATAGTGERP
jgi:hypothetical protein